MTNSKREESFLCLSVPPADMDRLWAEGWRHFGVFFFRYRQSRHGQLDFNVLPLRIDLDKFALSRSQKRVLKINQDAELVIGAATIDGAKEALFDKHKRRFSENVPSSLHDFLSPVPDSVPCRNFELCVYQGDRLMGVTFLDVGENATSAVYAVFDPAEAKRSLGILMMLYSIRFSRDRGYRYYYPGYAYREPFAYDYKKRFAGLEYFDWESDWRSYAPLQGRESPPLDNSTEKINLDD
jgi:arginyl-tRNA--protein-N-Asp/Glu arginylyltransferase